MGIIWYSSCQKDNFFIALTQYRKYFNVNKMSDTAWYMIYGFLIEEGKGYTIKLSYFSEVTEED